METVQEMVTKVYHLCMQGDNGYIPLALEANARFGEEACSAVWDQLTGRKEQK